MPATATATSRPLSASGSREKEFDFTERDFKRVRELIYRRAGIALSATKREMVYSRLSRRLRALGMSSFDDYLHALEASETGGRDNPEWESFVNALTTNLTSFFREAHHFDILARHLANRRDEVTIWCCAASTGEEPYTLAMTLVEAYGSWTPNARIIATDIDTNVLAQADAGVYPMERFDKLDPARLKRFFLKGSGQNTGMARVRPELRALIRFMPLNLLAEKWPVTQPVDVIFCRNVMIYFDKPTQTQILSRFAPLMKPGGLLFAGHSENFSYITQDFKLREKTVYQYVGKALPGGKP